MLTNRPRRLRFGLRTLFLLVTFTGVAVIPLTIRLARILQARAGIAEAIAEVERAHGLIEFDGSGHATRAYFVSRPPLADSNLVALAPHLKKLQSLKAIDLQSDRVTDNGIAQLAALTNLEELTIADSSITDAGVKSLCSLPRLKVFMCMRGSLTDTALESLGKLSHLEVIGLTGPGITDRGLEDLAKLSNLRQLTLVGTRTTDAGLKGLGEQLPKPLAVFDASANNPKTY